MSRSFRPAGNAVIEFHGVQYLVNAHLCDIDRTQFLGSSLFRLLQHDTDASFFDFTDGFEDVFSTNWVFIFTHMMLESILEVLVNCFNTLRPFLSITNLCIHLITDQAENSECDMWD